MVVKKQDSYFSNPSAESSTYPLHVLLTNRQTTNKKSREACGSDGRESACSVGDLGLIPGLERSLEKEMTTHSSILAWRVSWTEESGRLQSIGSQRVGHN